MNSSDLATTRSRSGRPSLEEEAIGLLSKGFPGEPREKIGGAARLASLLAKSQPNSVAYYQKAIPDILRNFDEKLLAWLTLEARSRLGANGDAPRRPDLAEDLKTIAAENGLRYSGEVVNDAIDSAMRELEVERQAQAELRAGALLQ